MTFSTDPTDRYVVREQTSQTRRIREPWQVIDLQDSDSPIFDQFASKRAATETARDLNEQERRNALRVAELESEGMTTSDAQAVADAESEGPRCESGWTGDRCQLPLHHDGDHDNESGPRCTAVDADECAMMLERAVAGISDDLPTCPVHAAGDEDAAGDDGGDFDADPRDAEDRAREYVAITERRKATLQRIGSRIRRAEADGDESEINALTAEYNAESERFADELRDLEDPMRPWMLDADGSTLTNLTGHPIPAPRDEDPDPEAERAAIAFESSETGAVELAVEIQSRLVSALRDAELRLVQANDAAFEVGKDPATDPRSQYALGEVEALRYAAGIVPEALGSELNATTGEARTLMTEAVQR